MKQGQLLDSIRTKVKEKLNGYEHYERMKNMNQLIITPALGDDAGLIGGFLLAKL